MTIFIMDSENTRDLAPRCAPEAIRNSRSAVNSAPRLPFSRVLELAPAAQLANRGKGA